MKISQYLVIIFACFMFKIHANTLTTDTLRRFGINSHIMHTPLYFKEKESIKEKKAKNQNHAKKGTQKPLKHQKTKRSKNRKLYDKMIPTTYGDDITTTKYPLLNL